MNNERGITLVELLATLTIFSLIIGVVYSLFSFSQANWTHTKGVTQSESSVQELQIVLTRELASPVSLTFQGNELRFEGQNGSFYILSLNGQQLSLSKGEDDFSNTSLLHTFSLPVQRMTLQNKNDSAISTLSEGMGYLTIYYNREGLKTVNNQIKFPISLYQPD
ncbi:PulJ/GspJ family protein [Pseudalkalibacillus sp. Hm43]|uniref:PulJ/GspJ family protein n=1 Tax=Pseudalkalibacillus sp. Hm43 TaxID=3450742 RepID=UPI003F43F197